MEHETSLILFQSEDGNVVLPVNIDSAHAEIWLNRNQIAELYDRDIKTIGKHLNNALKEELVDSRNSVVAKFATTASDGKSYQVEHYNLDAILSVGYRVKSQRGTEFRRWSNEVLRNYVVKGRVENEKRLRQLGEITSLIERLPQQLESNQILDVIKSYTRALDMLDDYDHQKLTKPEGEAATYVLSYDECRKVIDQMKFGAASDLFGNEKDDSFKGSIAAIYQSFGGKEIYPSLEEKAANLLYFVVKTIHFLTETNALQLRYSSFLEYEWCTSRSG